MYNIYKYYTKIYLNTIKYYKIFYNSLIIRKHIQNIH
uniref:Uncharacterized protein n=1 Tax=Chondria sp. (in: red algae) TaxID=1982705 RepID=A0A1Z1MCN4_9FLOR|nr:hypothetical protein [Chondria sp. (in: red algae)]